MQPGLSEVAGDVEADPGAVFDAHGAESVDELVDEGASDRGSTGGAAAERDADSDRAVSQLFAGGLDRPERRAAPDRRGDAGAGPEPATAGDRTGASTTTPAVLADLERAIDAAADDPAAVDPDDLDELDDADVEDALAAAADLDDEELPESVPAAWRDGD
jgi:hypothetical protein